MHTRHEYNELKYQVLRMVREYGLATSRDVADSTGMTHAGASSYLRKLAHMGLLQRGLIHEPIGPSGEFVYALSSKGEQRLAWLGPDLIGVHSP